MATVKDHYSNVLSDIYSWMFGGVENGIKIYEEFFKTHKISPKKSGIAVDLGAGCGFQSIPLAKTGYLVTSFDLDSKLLHELNINSQNLKITSIQEDLINFDKYVKNNIELAVCMTDTILHLETTEKVLLLFKKIFTALEPEGKFIITFRDLSLELTGIERFIPVKNDDNIIHTCFLEYETKSVNVYDIVYKKINNKWELLKSFYKKLRLSKKWVIKHLSECGFNKIDTSVKNGFITIIASK